jgi:hypothetical protein
MRETCAALPRRPWRRLAAVAGLIVAGLANGPGPAEAAAIRPARVAATAAAPRLRPAVVATRQARAATLAARDAGRWDAYFRRALQGHSLRVQVPQTLRGVRALAAAASQSDSAFVQYLRWRRGLNPARFDRNHPNVGPLLPEIPPVVPPIVPGNVPRPRPNPQVPVLPPAVPEPSTALVVAGLFAGAALWRRRGRSA